MVTKMSVARATEILGALMIWFAWKSRSWIVLVCSLLDQCVGSRANGLSTFRFDAVWFIDFSAKTLIDDFNGFGTVILSLISENPTSRFMLELMLLSCCVDFEFWYALLDLCASSLVWLWIRQHDTALRLWFLRKIRSVRILDTTVCSGSLVWLFSPTWDAVKHTLPGGWLHLSFRGHRPYRFRSDNCSCSRTNARQFPNYPGRRIPALLPFGIKASRVSLELESYSLSMAFQIIAGVSLLWGWSGYFVCRPGTRSWRWDRSVFRPCSSVSRRSTAVNLYPLMVLPWLA